ncbi:MAG: PilZ domain-containing protein [Gammaproteobacteria bacterium]|nr:PilZ domain-containing protein [Gammaproteobacteria bacterium]
MSDRRKFQRILFDSPVKVSDGTTEFISTLLDISLNGAFLIKPEEWQIGNDSPVVLTVLLEDGNTKIRMDARVAHQQHDTLGFRCERIDMDSISHLRRLVELNTDDPELLERELENLGR